MGAQTKRAAEVAVFPSKRDIVKVALCSADDSPEAATARALTRPQVQAAVTIQAFQGENLEVNALVTELSNQVRAVNSGDLHRAEGMLIAQAHTLDELFNNLARRSHRNIIGGFPQAAETYMRLALRAQNQCRATLETLAAVKNPPVFAKQANINNGGQQQINNGVPAPASGKPIPEIKKLESIDGEWMDTRAQSAAVGAHPLLAAVGKDNRPQDRRRKSKGLA